MITHGTAPGSSFWPGRIGLLVFPDWHCRRRCPAGATWRHGSLDVLSSDYVPMCLLPAAIRLYSDIGFSLPEASATVTASPAQAVGLMDRGVIESGKRADLLRVTRREGIPIIRSVWRAGLRVA